MTNWEKEQSHFHMNGISTYDIPPDIFKWLKDNSYKAKDSKELYTNKLVGHLKEEYNLLTQNPPKEVTNYIETRCMYGPFYEILKKVNVLTHNVPIILDSLWVNFQKKHEFNPIHNHSGFASFIIFVNIPYNLDDEENYFENINPDADKHTSKLMFINHFPHDGSINCKPIAVDKSFEGKMVMFGAKHLHEVYPFYTSDDYRITISGNLRYNTSQTPGSKLG